MSDKQLEMINSLWIKFDASKGKFGIKATTYFGEEIILFADDVDFSFIFPAKPRPGISKMNISTQGIVMKINQPFVISGEITPVNGKETLMLRLHHQQ